MNNEVPLLPARGDTTRDALIKAAIEIFGRDGFDAASTRAISDAAGVNQALIGYHFGGKPGLYLAALRSIADSVARRMGPLVDAIDADLAAEKSAEKSAKSTQRALALLHDLTDALVGMLTSDESAAWARLILREQQNPSDGFDVLYQGFMQRIVGATSRLVARIRNLDAAAEQPKLTAMTILGQAIIFRSARAAVMRVMGWESLGREEIESIRAELRRNVAVILEAQNSR
jgi:AcrR family transcriptional regulator